MFIYFIKYCCRHNYIDKKVTRTNLYSSVRRVKYNKFFLSSELTDIEIIISKFVTVKKNKYNFIPIQLTEIAL